MIWERAISELYGLVYIALTVPYAVVMAWHSRRLSQRLGYDDCPYCSTPGSTRTVTRPTRHVLEDFGDERLVVRDDVENICECKVCGADWPVPGYYDETIRKARFYADCVSPRPICTRIKRHLTIFGAIYSLGYVVMMVYLIYAGPRTKGNISSGVIVILVGLCIGWFFVLDKLPLAFIVCR